MNTCSRAQATTLPRCQYKRLASMAASAASLGMCVLVNAQTTTTQTSKTGGAGALEEVIVTAQKRSERLQDVPVPVTAVSAETLVAGNQLRLQDYYTSVPGLSVTPNVQSTQTVAIRGITTGGVGNPTVGIAIDDVPYGTSTGLQVPDFDPNDLQRVEVLRGPQGTLYGASSMGGLIKFVTVAPSTESMTGRAQIGTSSVYNGNGLGYNVRGSVNVPLTGALAVRASAFTREDPGYIDNPVLDIDGINRQRVSGGLLSALWELSEVVSLRFDALYQESRGDGASDVTELPGLGDLEQDYVRGAGRYQREVQAYSATLKATLGSGELTSITGYNINSFADSFDYTFALSPFAVAEFGVPGSPILNRSKTTKFTQEIRYSTPLGERFDWLVGAFYADEHKPFSQRHLAIDPVSGEVGGQGLHTTFPTTYEEYAAFTNLTYRATDRFDIQVGGRMSRIRQTWNQTTDGPYVPLLLGQESPYTTPERRSKGDPFTLLVTPRFKLSENVMLYARVASGYRAGGPNQAVEGVPAEYQPDKTTNYEIGMKGNAMNGALLYEASAYYIDWSDIQLALINPGSNQSYTANAGKAKSQGVELYLEAEPLTGLRLAAWLVWNDAVLTEGFPPTSSAVGESGDRLPYSSRFSGYLSLNKEFSLAGNLTGFMGAAVSYVGDREDVFGTQFQPLRQDLPAYAKTDVRGGLEYNDWTIDLFVTNVTNRRGVLGGGLGNIIPFAFTYIQPRTVGMSLAKSF
jgi:iron complex outermembrane recepter protein